MTHPTTITAEPGLPYVDVVREFDASAEAVFHAHVDRDQFAQWMGTRDMTMKVLEFEPTPGGRWEYEGRSGGGHAFGFRGVFHTVRPGALIVETFEFDGAPDVVGLSTMTFSQVGDRTRLTVHEIYPSVEVRDMVIATGMEHGVGEGYEKLDEILAA